MSGPESTDMAAESKGRLQRVRPIPIGEFGDMVLNRYKPTDENNRNHAVYNKVRRIIDFLTRHPSVKRTSDLTPSLVEDFARTCENLSDPSRGEALQYFGIVCNLAVKWEHLKRSPIERNPIPKKTLRPDESASKAKNSTEIRSRAS